MGETKRTYIIFVQKPLKKGHLEGEEATDKIMKCILSYLEPILFADDTSTIFTNFKSKDFKNDKILNLNL
jgi:hypothetical protein